MLSVHVTWYKPQKFKNATFAGHFGTLGQGSHMIIVRCDVIVFKMFSFHMKTKSRRFQIPLV